MSIRCSSGLHLKHCLKFCSLNYCTRPTSETYRGFVAWIKPFVPCVFWKGQLQGGILLMSLSHPTSSPTHSHTSSHPVNSLLFWSHFSSWRRINCTSKRRSAPPHSDTCCDHRLCTFVLLLLFMLLRLHECPTAICESVKKKVLGLRGTRGNRVFYWRRRWTFPVFKTLSITLNWMYLLHNYTFLALVYVS